MSRYSELDTRYHQLVERHWDSLAFHGAFQQILGRTVPVGELTQEGFGAWFDSQWGGKRVQRAPEWAWERFHEVIGNGLWIEESDPEKWNPCMVIESILKLYRHKPGLDPDLECLLLECAILGDLQRGPDRDSQPWIVYVQNERGFIWDSDDSFENVVRAWCSRVNPNLIDEHANRFSDYGPDGW
jgi:hypothetical protein